MTKKPAAEDARADIHARLRSGHLSREDASAEARALDLEPLLRIPPAERHNPEAKARWTLSMGLAWIVWRDFGEVRRWDNDYRAEADEWRACYSTEILSGEPRTIWGWEVHPQLAATACVLLARAAPLGEGVIEEHVRPVDARAALWHNLQGGLLTAEAIDLRTEARVAIPSLEWRDLKPEGLAGERERVVSRLNRRVAYEDIVLSREELLGAWPAPGPRAPTKKRWTASKRTAAVAAVAELYPSGFQGQVPDKVAIQDVIARAYYLTNIQISETTARRALGRR